MEWKRESTLSELLGDPIAKALMVADRIEQRDLDVLLATVRWHLRQRRVLRGKQDEKPHCLAWNAPGG
jgi:hypothetical protein